LRITAAKTDVNGLAKIPNGIGNNITSVSATLGEDITFLAKQGTQILSVELFTQTHLFGSLRIL